MPVLHTKGRTKFLGIGVAVLLSLLYVAYLAFLYHVQLDMFYPGRHYPLPANHHQLPVDAERWWLPVQGGNVGDLRFGDGPFSGQRRPGREGV